MRDAVVKIEGNDGAFGSAVCVSEDGLFVSAGHIGFTKDKTYKATTERATYTLKCLQVRMLKDDKGEGVVLLRDVDRSPRHTYFQIGTTPELMTRTYGIGYAGCEFCYCEGPVTGLRNGTRFILCGYRMMNGASGGACAIEKNNQLIGILSSRTLLATEPAPPGTVKSYDPPSTTWIGCDVFRPCVEDWLKSEGH
jgi:hypothetical protein